MQQTGQVREETMKNALRLLIPLLALAAVGAWIWQNQQQVSAGDTLKLYGNIDMREVQLAINASDRIVTMLAQEGDQVHKGQLLAEVDGQRLQALADGADARVEAQQALLDRMLAGSRPEDIRKAQAELAATEAQAMDAQRTSLRLRKLSKKDMVSRERADNATTVATAARERVKAATQLLQLVVQGPRQEDIDTARAQLKAEQAQLALAQHNLHQASLYAPIDGIIRNRILEPGDMATPQQPVYTLAITDPMWVRAYLSETDLGRVSSGMQAEVESDSFPGKRYRAWVGYISPSAEFTPQSVQTEEIRSHLVYQVRVQVCNPDGELRLGMPVTVLLSLKQPRHESNTPCNQVADAGQR